MKLKFMPTIVICKGRKDCKKDIRVCIHAKEHELGADCKFECEYSTNPMCEMIEGKERR